MAVAMNTALFIARLDAAGTTIASVLAGVDDPERQASDLQKVRCVVGAGNRCSM